MRNWLLTFALAAFAAAAVPPGPAAAAGETARDRQFRTWLAAEFWPRARAGGIARPTFDAVAPTLRPDWTLPGLDGGATATRAQAEFGGPDRYFDAASLQRLASEGRILAHQNRQLLARLERETGVPGRILLAVWARESRYGRAALTHDAITVLATRAFAGPRRDYYAAELIAALELIQTGRVSRGAMRSGWGGALGQPQFMPSRYRALARDGDGDGRVDLWISAADSLASIAAYLQRSGWQAGRDWGFEVTLPPGLHCTALGPDRQRPMREWSASGVRRVRGRDFPAAEAGRAGFLLMPAGTHGPAFIATGNFLALKAYNQSDLYALWVGNLADRIAFGMGDFVTPWRRVPAVGPAEIRRIQAGLVRIGLNVGGVDGLAGFRTRRAIGVWQEREGQTPTCYPQAGMALALAGRR